MKNKTVWVTGASSGIGAAIAKYFSQQGANIILSGRRVDALETTKSALANDGLILPFDTTDYAALAAHVETAWKWKGRVDVLVNNAGISQRSLAIHTAPEVYTKLINVDLIAPIWLTQLCLPKMVAADGGQIIAISSVAGRIGAPLRTAYSAAKHGLIGYMDALRAEVELPHNIKVLNVLPGSVATNVDVNALAADGTDFGKRDENIQNGDDPMDCAAAIYAAMLAGDRELIFADGLELQVAKMRHEDPEQLFTILGQMGAQTVAAYEKGFKRILTVEDEIASREKVASVHKAL